MKAVSIYKRRNQILLHPQSQTTDGVWIAGVPVRGFELTEDPSKIGTAIEELFEHSLDGVPHPVDWAAITKPVLDAAGVKSWATFAKNAQHCALEKDDKGVKVIPHQNLGPSHGFEPLKATTMLAEYTPDDIGSIVLEWAENY